MNYLSLLSEDEIRYICSVIPQRDTIAYFQHNPKEFAKICPGFRAIAITRFDVGNLLFRHRNRDFVSLFIEKNISNWLSQIQERVDKCIVDGDGKDLAYIHTLPFCFFAGNVALYFKLIEVEHPEEYIAILASTVKAIKEATEEQEKLQATLKAKESDVNRLQLELNSTISDIKNIRAKLNERLIEIKALKRAVADFEKLETAVQDGEKVIAELKAKIHEQEKTTQELRVELSASKDSRHQLEAQIRDEMKKQQAAKAVQQEVAQKPICPKDMEEFKDCLGYNLENIGVPTGSEYYSLLKEHLNCILFQGIPIVINRGVGVTLMRCVANALIGTSNVKTLTFKNDISIQAIDDFLSTNGRVVCLDNFIGNYNETELIPLFDKHRNKVIFLTVAYDRTLHFVPDEFLKYCHYLNLNRIGALLANAELTEDPSTVEEIEAVSQRANPDSRYSLLLREMLGEFGFRQSLVEYKCVFISNEQDLCRALAFDVLPYCIDVLQIAPYNTSELLNKYARDSGRCSYKNLFKEWFA